MCLCLERAHILDNTCLIAAHLMQTKGAHISSSDYNREGCLHLYSTSSTSEYRYHNPDSSDPGLVQVALFKQYNTYRTLFVSIVSQLAHIYRNDGPHNSSKHDSDPKDCHSPAQACASGAFTVWTTTPIVSKDVDGVPPFDRG